MVEPQVVSSFVLRFSCVDEEEIEQQWRIRVTHVQGEDEIVVNSISEAVKYMEGILKKG